MMTTDYIYPETAARLIAWGARVNARADDGRTPLTFARTCLGEHSGGTPSDARKNEIVQLLIGSEAVRGG
jgi:hypothetical protein